MGTLAIDIETASPDEEPPSGGFDDTAYFELVAVALGYRESPASSVDSEVLFREGGWDRKWTGELLGRALGWTDGREIDEVLTYNGTGFDLVHLRNWAKETDDTGITEGALDRVASLDSKQVDLKYPAIEHHRDLIEPNHEFPKFELVCDARSVSTTDTAYDDYDINADFLRSLGLGATVVKGWHIGSRLGERYVEGVANGLDETLTYRELNAMLSDYAEADVRPLFDLYDSFGDGECKRSSST